MALSFFSDCINHAYDVGREYQILVHPVLCRWQPSGPLEKMLEANAYHLSAAGPSLRLESIYLHTLHTR